MSHLAERFVFLKSLKVAGQLRCISWYCRRCIEVASGIGSTNAVRYIRRASELCEALSGPVVGLSQDCMEYIRSHPSNVYDSAVMHAFAEGLCKAGQRDRAATVYYTLLQVARLPMSSFATSFPLISSELSISLFHQRMLTAQKMDCDHASDWISQKL